MIFLQVSVSRGATTQTLSPLPWTKAVLHAKKLFLSATTTIEISQVARCQILPQLWNLPGGHTARLPGAAADVIRTSTSMPFGRSERTTTWIDATSGAVLQTEKLNTGSKMYWKLRRFGAGGYFEWRRAPATIQEERRSHHHWSKRSSRWHPWNPRPPAGAIVTSSYALLALLSKAHLDRPNTHLTILIPSHGRLVELSFVPGTLRKVATGFTIQRGSHSRTVRGTVTAREVDGSARWLGGGRNRGPAETGFMGMRGPLAILLQTGSAVPLRVTGTAKGIGRLVVRLKTVTLPSGDHAPVPQPR